MGKEELYFATYFSAKQTTENGKEILRLAFCGVLRRNKHALNISDLVAYKGPPFNPDNSLVDLDEPTPESLFERPHFPPLPTTIDSFTAE